MIEYRKGNLLDVQSGIIVHGANAQGVMGSGVALAIKNKYPGAYANYKEYQRINGELHLGSFSCVHVNSDLIICNAITQQFYGRDGKRYVNYWALGKVFTEIFIAAKEMNAIVHFPKIGAGFGGGDWNIIEQILNDVPLSENVKQICWEL